MAGICWKCMKNLALVIRLESLNPRVCFSKSSDLVIVFDNLSVIWNLSLPYCQQGFRILSRGVRQRVCDGRPGQEATLESSLKSLAWGKLFMRATQATNFTLYDCSWEQWKQLTSPEYISSISPAVLAVLHRVPRWDQLRLHLSIVKLQSRMR